MCCSDLSLCEAADVDVAFQVGQCGEVTFEAAQMTMPSKSTLVSVVQDEVVAGW